MESSHSQAPGATKRKSCDGDEIVVSATEGSDNVGSSVTEQNQQTQQAEKKKEYSKSSS
jgi:hypothetical protein